MYRLKVFLFRIRVAIAKKVILEWFLTRNLKKSSPETGASALVGFVDSLLSTVPMDKHGIEVNIREMCPRIDAFSAKSTAEIWFNSNKSIFMQLMDISSAAQKVANVEQYKELMRKFCDCIIPSIYNWQVSVGTRAIEMRRKWG